MLVCHARGVLAAASEDEPEPVLAWPPTGAEPVAVDGLYPMLTEYGLHYGPLFQNVRAVWRAGDEVYAEVALSDNAPSTGFAVHPALFDATLHTGMLDTRPGDPVVLPFSWSGIRLGRAGATAVRVRVSPAGESAVRIVMVDDAGQLVVSVDKLAVRTVEPGQLGRARKSTEQSLYQVDWATVATPNPATCASRSSATSRPRETGSSTCTRWRTRSPWACPPPTWSWSRSRPRRATRPRPPARPRKTP
ncbi:polyketide synthase dehydratase domain-containing protein [Kitasatospora aburaviensis]